MVYLDKEIIARRELESLHTDMQAMRDSVALESSSVLDQARHDAKHIRSQSELLASQERDAILAIAQVEADPYQGASSPRFTSITGIYGARNEIKDCSGSACT